MRYLTTGIIFTILLTVMGHGAEAQKTDHFQLDETYPLESEGIVKLQSSDADVKILGSSRDDVHLVVNYTMEITGFALEEGDRFGMNIRQDDGQLIIEEKERELPNATASIGFTKVEYTITLEVPEKIHLDIAGDDDTYRISNVDRSISLDADDAGVELRNCEGEDFFFEMDDGDLQMDRAAGRLKLVMDDGAADIARGSLRDLNVDMEDGSVSLATELFDDGRYRLSMDDGRLDLSIVGGGGIFRIDHDNTRFNVAEPFTLTEEGDTHKTYRLAGGNAEVQIRIDDGRIQLNTL
ncbi:MAG: DUF4097 family beta strand repeat-containing protein [Balneolaceae bacterium]|nr:DUF4097 family beta strand repeat-containing protein [Balneolaceae bacterium]